MAIEHDNPRGKLRDAIKRNLQSALEHHRAGRLDKAEALYCKVLNQVPDQPDALHLLGAIAIARGQPERAIELIGKALRYMPKLFDAHVNLGNALLLLGRLPEAVESYERAIAINSRSALVHSNLARVLNDLKRFAASLPHCRMAIDLEPHFLPAHINMAIALKGSGHLAEAVGAWRKSIALDPHTADSHHELALLLGELEQFAEALECHKTAIALQPDNAVFHCAFGTTHLRKPDAVAAAESFRKAVALSPDFVEALVGLGWALRLCGEFDEAEQWFKRIREIDPNYVEAYRYLSSTGKHGSETDEIGQLMTLLARDDVSAKDRIVAGFSLGRLLDNADRYDEAFRTYEVANAQVRQTWPATGDRFDRLSFTRWVDLLISTYTPEYFESVTDRGIATELPVFIVGMPRSGTTLVEQICASHSLVFGAGERHDIDRIATTLAGGRAHHISKHDANADQGLHLAEIHVERLRMLGAGAIRVIDKMPDNILQVGLIVALFPKARIIVCSRDSRDTSLSCFFQLFGDGLMHFSYDLGDCGYRCREICRLVRHWLDVLPKNTIEIQYESLVHNLESESRRLIEFLGLDWQPTCLDFYRTERTVTTVSHWQVRQPIYTRSVARWLHYEQHLGELAVVLKPPVDPAAGSG